MQQGAKELRESYVQARAAFKAELPTLMKTRELLPKLLKDPVSILKDPLNFVSDRVVSTSDSACNVTVKIPGEEPRVGASVAFSPFENASLSFNQQAEVKVDTGEFTLNPLAPRAALLLTMNLPSLRFPFSLFLHATLCSLATR